MAKADSGFRLSEIAEAVNGELRGDDRVVLRPVPAESSDPDGISFATSEEFLKKALSSGVGAIIVPPECPAVETPVIAAEDPRRAVRGENWAAGRDAERSDFRWGNLLDYRAPKPEEHQPVFGGGLREGEKGKREGGEETGKEIARRQKETTPAQKRQLAIAGVVE